jgi:hypothetical protein
VPSDANPLFDTKIPSYCVSAPRTGVSAASIPVCPDARTTLKVIEFALVYNTPEFFNRTLVIVPAACTTLKFAATNNPDTRLSVLMIVSVVLL